MLSIQHALEHHLVAPVVDLVPLDVDFVIAQPPRVKVSGELAGDDNFGGLRGEGARECGAVGAGGGIGGDGVILHEEVCVLRRVAGWEFVDKGGGIYSQWFLHFFSGSATAVPYPRWKKTHVCGIIITPLKCPAIAASSNAQVHDGGRARVSVLAIIALPAEAQDALKVHEDPRGHLGGH